MKIIKKIEDLKLTKRLPSSRLHKEDIIKLDQKMRRQIKQHDKIFEIENNEIAYSNIHFTIESSGELEGIHFANKKENIEEFFAFDNMGNKLNNLEITWILYHGVTEKEMKSPTQDVIQSVLTRNITISFSKERCNVRISGENAEWIKDTYTLLNAFIQKRPSNNRLVSRTFKIGTVFLSGILIYSLAFLFTLIFWSHESFETHLQDALTITILFGSFIYIFLYVYLDLTLPEKFPYSEIIIKSQTQKRSIFKDYSIQILLGIIEGIIVASILSLT